MSIFSIMTTVDLAKLDSEITKYINQNGNFNPYIFMNEDTINAIEKENDIDAEYLKDPQLKSKYKGTIATYCGYKVFINNDLRFGMVEIR